ncbi:replication initiator protein RepSA [Streptomyces melanogenes]|uniref:replication initiator protein RepSA n=1 Tax=Streptomyces melanogenes TaxID=67326 RepID=UPI002E309DE8|nr:replication initiator protein RepSA [Streptomyces melanogenes]
MAFPVAPAAVAGVAAAVGTDPITLADALRVVNNPGFERWQEQVRRTGGCAQPIHLCGYSRTVDTRTGEFFEYSTSSEPGGRLRIACGNRRASRCPSCAWMYAGDTYQLIMAGLVGGKGVPASVTDRPRVFATLTAPSFGPVHNRPTAGHCRCGAQHGEDDPRLGTALDPERYNYAGAVLWNNHAGALWQRFTIYLRREVARRAGLTQAEFSDHARVSFGKVAEFQKRGAVHFHAIIRIDGPTGPDSEPPAWASVALLECAIRAAAARVCVVVPANDEYGFINDWELRWGTQLDVQPIGALDGDDVSEQAVGAYVAKYATKAAETTGTLDRRIGELAELDGHPGLPDHTRRLIEACWALDAAYPERLLAHWSHMLGFRGHFSTKTPQYSTTLGALRGARADWRARQERHERGLADPDSEDDVGEDTTLVLAHWEYAGQGHTPGESWLAASIARDLKLNRDAAREALADLPGLEGGGWDE